MFLNKWVLGQYLAYLLYGSLVITSASSQKTPIKSIEPTSVIHQLRTYEIFDGNKQEFHRRFQDHAMRIMSKYDFKIVATWESHYKQRTEFVYLLQWSDTTTMRNCWAKFISDKEWIEIKKRTANSYGQLVGEIEDRTLMLTDYSPRRLLVN